MSGFGDDKLHKQFCAVDLTQTVYPSLKKIQFCGWGNVGSLEKFVLSAPNLTDLEISNGDCYDTPLVEAITKLTGLTNLELPFMACPDHEIPEPEIENEFSGLFDTPFNETVFPLFDWILSENISLTNLNLANQNFLNTSAGRSKTNQFIEKNTKLKKLTLSDKNVEFPKEILERLQKNSTLEVLNMVEFPTDNSTRELAEKIMKEKNVRIILNFPRKA